MPSDGLIEPENTYCDPLKRILQNTEEVVEISQNSQENTCARVSFLKKLQAWSLQFY